MTSIQSFSSMLPYLFLFFFLFIANYIIANYINLFLFFFLFIANYILTSLAIDRAVAVGNPITYKQKSNPRIANITCLSLTILLAVLCTPILEIATADEDACSYRQSTDYLSKQQVIIKNTNFSMTSTVD